MTAKTPTASGISRLLASAGFERSTSSATRIKGWRNSSEGYTVSGYGPGEVCVEHKTGYDRGPNAQKRREETLGEYAKAITDAGYAVTTGVYGRLIVTAKAEAPLEPSPRAHPPGTRRPGPARRRPLRAWPRLADGAGLRAR